VAPPVTFDLTVRYHECDVQGVVFNAIYYTYADMAGLELWKAACGGYDVVLDRGVDTVVATSSCIYLSPARWEDELTLEVGVARVGDKSFDAATTIQCGDILIAELSVTYVFIDRATFSSVAPLPDLRQALEKVHCVTSGSSSAGSEAAIYGKDLASDEARGW
jgi:acyl-CoA thioester hydrolase